MFERLSTEAIIQQRFAPISEFDIVMIGGLGYKWRINVEVRGLVSHL
jgi:hypothetical protein